MMNAYQTSIALSGRGFENASLTEILTAGLFYAGFHQDRQDSNKISRKLKWFKAFYGVEPSAVAPLFSAMKTIDTNVTYKKCLMTMNWLRLYESYPILSGRWGYSEELIGSTVIAYGVLMAQVGRANVIFELEHPVELGRTVDCSTFMVNEMRLDPSSKWFDYKTNSCGLVSTSISAFSLQLFF